MRIRIWLASAIVIILILLLALTVNHAREKDMVEIFSRQQLAYAKNSASRIADAFSQAEKNIALFSRVDQQKKKLPEEINDDFKILYSGWEKSLDAIALIDAEGNVKRIFPPAISPAVTLPEHFQTLAARKKKYLNITVADKSNNIFLRQNAGWYLVIGFPVWHENKFAGAWIGSFSLTAIINDYEKQSGENDLGYLWLTDEQGTIIVHSDSALIEGNVKRLLSASSGTDIDFSADSGNYLETLLLQDGKQRQRSVVAYYPLPAGDRKLIVFVAAPYNQIISPVRKTFVYSLFSALLLVLVVIAASMSFAYREGKKLRIKEEQARAEEREAWQEKLLREKKTIDGIIEGSPIPTFVIDKEHKAILWNRACTELTGYPASEVIGTEKYHTPFYPVKRPLIADLIINHDLEGLDKYYGTKKIKKSDKVLGAYEATDYFENLGGVSRFLYFLAAPIYDEKGEIIAAIETLQDVSREEELTGSLRKYAETLQNKLTENIKLRQEIEELYNYLQSIVKSLPDKIFVLDENGFVSYMSNGFKKEDDLSARKLDSSYFLDFIAPADKDFVLARWEDARRGVYKPYEIEVTAKDGRKVNLLVSISPIAGTNRHIIVQRDITEFKDMENKLYESQKLAALGQLSAGIAHEVRNPLSSIKMSLQILEKRMNPSGNDLKRFKIAEKEVEHLEELVDNVLVFAKPMEPKMKKLDITKVLEHAVAMTEKGIADKKIDLRYRFAEVPPLTADAEMMADAFLNIIRNAVEAVDENGHVTISLRRADCGRDGVEIRVSDNGCGIAAEDMPHLFNPFFTRKKYGTGLGLSQVKKIIDIHSGTIDIVSEKGKGATIIIMLPLETATERRSSN